MKKILVSACLLGFNCKYNGKNNMNEFVLSLKNNYELIPFCPEMDGGLPCPRNPSEIINDKVINNIGIDVTNNYNLGANKALILAKNNNPVLIISKEKSPSCGVNYIYDGTFTSKLIKGSGITTRLLKDNGYKVISEDEAEKEISKFIK